MGSPDMYVVERQRHIDAPATAILERIVDFRRWRQWSPWEELDPSLQRTYSGADSGPGAVYEWTGNRKAGQGRMEITRVTDDDVAIDLQFIKPFKSRSTTVFRVHPDGDDGTTVTWTMTGQKTLMTKVLGIFKSMDKMIGPDFENGLDRLAADAESA
jgi:hypothetical protein